ncbi:cell division protein SepF [Staphylococcus sp. SQ8-PEA]|uniref:Cell division protein SepF n=1 Tax=Staphylococcus marylandisciuri TaxID=2981529 RepID=A0ABT2QP17_9STAP|nr:cell division protein SepF [Staphylococcus marylandisciuri]MCU5745725.1 cell division protein SepF [Staphylococcus marylandisciuri]
MALKDLFNGFFTVEEEDEELEAPPQKEQHREPVQEKNQATEPSSTNRNERQRSLQSVPKKQSSRYQSSNKGERKYQMNQSQHNVVNMNNQSDGQYVQESSKMCLFEPRVFSDTQDIADELKNRRATLVNLQRIDKVSAKRIIDFLSGTVYAIGGDIQRVGSDIFLCTPDNVEVAGTITDQIENGEFHSE